MRVPDLLVLRQGTIRTADLDFAPSPLLVVEVASPSTRSSDRTIKADDYLSGGAAWYLLVDLPGLAPVQLPTAELWRNLGDRWSVSWHAEVLALPSELGSRNLDLTELVLHWG